jgi:hypothetical protein
MHEVYEPTLTCVHLATGAGLVNDRSGNEEPSFEAAQRKRAEFWARWVQEHPDEAGASAELFNCRPQDLPLE